jgi:hypothetical protein
MTRASAYFLTRLKTFLASQPSSKRRELQKLHEKLADGRKLHTVAISRHLNLIVTPSIDTAIVYLRFAKENGIIVSGKASKDLFEYINNDVPVKKERKNAVPA